MHSEPSAPARLQAGIFADTLPQAIFDDPEIGPLWSEWREARRRLDYDFETDAALEVAQDTLTALTERVLSFSVTSPAASLLKLVLLVELAPIVCGDAAEFPWPEIRRIATEMAFSWGQDVVQAVSIEI